MNLRKFNILILLIVCLFSFTGCTSISELKISTEYIEKNMYVGDKIVLKTNADNEEEVSWESSDELVATVSNEGLVTAISAGEVTIVATYGEFTSIAIINVYERAIINDLDIKIIGEQSVLVNESIQLSVQINSDKYKDITWSSSDSKIATIDQSGAVTALKPGVVTITATLTNYPLNYKDFLILVRTGDGIQDVINNYIYNNLYKTNGDYNLLELNETVVNLVKTVEKSVIGVSNYSNEAGTSSAGTGTGGIYKREKTTNGYLYTVFTNHHVIEDAKCVKVYLGDLDEYVVANIIKSDANLDLAVLTFEHTNLYDPLKLGTIGSVANGDFVVAIGNPGGYSYYGSVTFGMISKYNRVHGNNKMVYVQHDAPINPGNSGGPLFNLKGEVIGINTLKLVSDDIEGMGFAIAMEEFLEYLNTL